MPGAGTNDSRQPRTLLLTHSFVYIVKSANAQDAL